ncbi:MAG: hypothetical protein ABFR95_11040, partial [Actinomycetota bacterium]
MIRRALFLALAVLIVGSLAGPATGGSLDDELKEIRQSVLALSAQIDDVAAEKSMLAQDVLAAQGKLEAVEARVATADAKLTRISLEHEERTAALTDIRAELADRFATLSFIRSQRDTALEDAKASVLNAYMNGG